MTQHNIVTEGHPWAQQLTAACREHGSDIDTGVTWTDHDVIIRRPAWCSVEQWPSYRDAWADLYRRLIEDAAVTVRGRSITTSQDGCETH